MILHRHAAVGRVGLKGELEHVRRFLQVDILGLPFLPGQQGITQAAVVKQHVHRSGVNGWREPAEQQEQRGHCESVCVSHRLDVLVDTQGNF